MKAEEYLWTGIGVFGIADCAWFIFSVPSDLDVNWLLISIAAVIGGVLGMLPWLLLRYWGRSSGGICFLYAYVGGWVGLRMLSLFVRSPASGVFSISSAVGYWYYYHSSSGDKVK